MTIGSNTKIVFVHWRLQNASGWSRVETKLEADGCKVLGVNIPGRAGDKADPHKLTTNVYKQIVLKAISAGARPVILVGHSYGGITISNAAEAAPEKTAALVYLSVYLPKNGGSLQSLSPTDADSALGKDGNFVVSPDYAYASIKPGRGAEIFGNDASPSDGDVIGKSLIPDLLAAMVMPANLTTERFGKVTKYYIENDARFGRESGASAAHDRECWTETSIQDQRRSCI